MWLPDQTAVRIPSALHSVLLEYYTYKTIYSMKNNTCQRRNKDTAKISTWEKSQKFFISLL